MNRKIKRRFFPMIAIFCFILLPLTACSDTANADSSSNTASGNSGGSEGIKITLTGNSAQCDSNSVSIGNGNVTIGNEGTYLLSGTLQDGMIVIAADDTDKVRLIFDGVSVSNGSNAAIFVQSADKVFITLNDGTTNILENGGSYTPIGSTNVDSVIFSKCDLTIDGGGSLQVTAAEGHGIVTKDDLKITDGTFTVTAKEDGFNAGKTIQIDKGVFTINAGDDGFHSDESITVNDGSIDIATCNEGIEGGSITISGGYIQIHSDDDGINAASDTNGNPSLLISGGTVYINALGDGIDSNGSFSVTGGALYVSGPVNNANSAIDYETSGQITGGIVVAAGSSGMAMNFGNTSTQGSILLNTGNQTAGTEITAKDSDGKELISYTPENNFSSVVISCPEMVQGGTYIISVGGTEQSITLENLIYGNGMNMGNWGNQGFPGDMHGPGGHDRNMHDPMLPDGEFPNMPDGETPTMPTVPDGETPDMPTMPENGFPKMPDGGFSGGPDGEVPDMQDWRNREDRGF